MVLDISRINHGSIEHLTQANPSQKTQGEKQLFGDVLCYAKEQGIMQRFVASAKSSFFRIYGKVKWFFSKLFSCFGLFESSMSQKLQIFKENLQKVIDLQTQFPKKVRGLKEKELKEWWMDQFESLDPEVQRMLLIVDIKVRKPHEVDEKREKWAYENLEEYRTLATEFVVKLVPETIDGDTFSPLDDLPNYLEDLKSDLESKMKDLESKLSQK